MSANNNIELLLANRIYHGLRKRTLTSCSRWAEEYRVVGSPYPGKWTFTHHPWLRDMHDSNVEMNIGQKSAQMGFTETVLNRVFYSVHIRQLDCLYVLPSKNPDANNFSAARFNAALELSPPLAALFSDVQNVGHKRAGTANVYIRGAKSRSQLKSIPAGLIVIDELDEMPPKNIPLAFERSTGQLIREGWKISTPTIPEAGINLDFLDSSQNSFFFRCPSCSRFVDFTFPESIRLCGESVNDPEIERSELICKLCQASLPHNNKRFFLSNTEWVSKFPKRDSKGWYINQLYSPTVSPVDIAKKYLNSLSNPHDEQEFHNSTLGLPHTVKGSNITDEDINQCIGTHHIATSSSSNRVITMGVDIGNYLHWEIDEWIIPPGYIVEINMVARPRVIAMGKIPFQIGFHDLDRLMSDFRVNFCVLDSQPESRLVLEFCHRWYGRAKACRYSQGVEGKNINVFKDEPKIHVDRTTWLDLSLGRFKKQDGIRLPIDTPIEYRNHVKKQVRIYTKDKHGNNVGRWVTPSGEDHFGHARCYAEIALPLATSNQIIQNIQGRIL